MIEIYAERCQRGDYFKERQNNLSKTKAYLKRKLGGGDWYMTADEAVYYGFVDGIYK